MTTKRRFLSALPALVLALAFICTFGFTLANVASAEDLATADKIGSISIAHISDIHYFPIEYSYTKIAEDNYTDSDFYYSMTGDTKLVLESGAILNANVTRFVEEAKAGNAPHYLFATGDLCKNGERVALIDVANALRHLQNEVRKVAGYENFQVFVITGNHDLYNGSGALYDQTDGSGYLAETVTAAQFALIFAGLGFPNASLDGSIGTNLSEIYPESYWSSDYTNGYVQSSNASNLTFEYYSAMLNEGSDEYLSDWYYRLGSSRNGLSYRVEIANEDYVFFLLDGTDREVAESPVPARINKAEYDIIAADGKLDEHQFFVATADGKINLTPCDDAAVQDAFSKGEPVYINTGWNHLTGGRITEGVFNWIDLYTLAAENVGKTYVAAYHFNALPHFEQEDDILKDFVFYNWENTYRRLLEAGIRYGLGGHMHASDIAYQTDAAGRTFYELETGSSVSYDSPIRYITIDRYALDGGAIGEKFTSSVHALQSLAGFASSGITNPAPWNDAAFKAAYEEYTSKENPTEEDWDKVVATNPEYLAYMLHYDAMNSMSYNEYITEEIYGQLADRIVDHFINIKTITDLNLTELVSGAVAGFQPLAKYAPLVGKIVDYLVDSILYDLYPDGEYPYNGNVYPNAIEYVKAVAGTLLNLEFGQDGHKLTLSEMASFIMMAHTSGTEPTTDDIYGGELDKITGTASSVMTTDPVYRAMFVAALKDFSDKCDSGELAETLVTTLLDPIYSNEDSLLRTLLNYRFDLTKIEGGLTDEEEKTLTELFDTLESLLNILLGSDLNITLKADNITIGNLMPVLWPVLQGFLNSSLGLYINGADIFEGVDGLLDDYLTESFYVGLSGIAKNIVVAFATDDEKDTDDIFKPQNPYVLTPHEGYAEKYAALGCGQLTYVSSLPVSAEFNPATQENGRLPSALTANFSTEENKGGNEFKLSFYTAEEIGAEVVLYDNGGNVIETVRITTADLEDSTNKEYRTTSKNGEHILLNGETRAQYIPLIDLGLLCIQHTEVTKEVTVTIDGKEEVVEQNLTYLDRDNADGNSVVYKNRFTVTFYGLEPGKDYGYEVRGVYGDGDSAVTFGLAESIGEERFAFSTAPDKTVTDFDFVAIADMQGMIESMYETAANTLSAIKANTDSIDFVLNAGDMADNGKNFYQWQWALNHNLDFFANTSTFTAAGNHEDGTYALDKFYEYNVPEGTVQSGETGLFYSFDYATAHIIVLDTNDITAEKGLNEAQYNWLRNDLIKNVGKSEWTFVLMHKSLYSGGSHSYDAEVVTMRKQLEYLFYTYGVDIVFGGHDHTYSVTKFLDGDGNISSRKFENDEKIYSSDKGVAYVTLGTVGTKFYDYNSNPETESKFNKRLSETETLTQPTFVKISVRGDELTYKGYTVNADGTVSEIFHDVDDPDPATPSTGGDDGTPDDNGLYVKIFVPIAVILVVAGVVTAVVIVLRKKKAAAESAKGKGGAPLKQNKDNKK